MTLSVCVPYICTPLWIHGMNISIARRASGSQLQAFLTGEMLSDMPGLRGGSSRASVGCQVVCSNCTSRRGLACWLGGGGAKSPPAMTGILSYAGAPVPALESLSRRTYHTCFSFPTLKTLELHGYQKLLTGGCLEGLDAFACWL